MANGKSYLIGYDASRAFVPEATGTENYSLNLLRALAKIDRKNKYRGYLRSTVGGYGNEARIEKSKAVTLEHDRRLTLNETGIVTDRRITKNWPSNFEFKVIRPSRLW